MKLKKANDLTNIAKEGMKLLAPARTRITVGMATCGLAKGAGKVYEALKYELKKQKIKADLVVVGCNGLCYAEPIVEVIRVGKPRVTYGNVSIEQVNELVSSIKSGAVLKDLVIMRHDKFKKAVGNESIPYAKGKLPKAYSGIKEAQRIDFYKRQMKLVSSGAGTISPDHIEEYCALGGYQALASALTGMDPATVIKEVTVSKLRGRGGAGFPTGIKWQTCHQADDTTKYIVCNGSEGDPEIGMHRSFLESDPHLVIEGMAIAGYAVGAQEGYIYVNDKYTVALERLEKAIAQAEKLGLLGQNILGSGFSFAVKIKRGGGAYVCGEETALLNALEGSFGEPRPRPPYPAEKGLFGKPTVVNNLETLASIPVIIKKGGKWFAGIGTPASKGTKIVALSGNVAQRCWVEVPLGTGIKEIIETFGKGAAQGKKIKAFQAGGPSGGILPAKSLKMKLDYDQLSKAGSLLGSGGLLVMDEDTDMLDMAKFFTDFFADESCGKCSTCREGCKRLQDILEGIMEGQGTPEHIKLIKRLDSAMAVASACALGKTAAVPIISVLKHFPKEIEGRLVRKKA
jgi:NADH:ubiquinone oxidoreductase subunit F (NADH-binding)/(2Fe-2S) ferredoxin